MEHGTTAAIHINNGSARMKACTYHDPRVNDHRSRAAHPVHSRFVIYLCYCIILVTYVVYQITGCIQRRLGNTWKISSVYLDHSGHEPNPQYTKRFPCFRGFTPLERLVVSHKSDSTLLQRRQIVSLAAATLQRYITAKDISNALA